MAWATVANIKGPPGTGTSGVSSVFTRTGDVVAATNDYTFAQIGSKPTTLAGYGITDPVVLTSGSYSNPAWITALAWSKITGAPTTLSGYGITDAQPLDADLTAIAALATTSFGRGGLTQADAASFRSYIGAGTSTVTPAALTKTDDTNVTLALGGTPATALLQAASLTLGWTGTLAVARGGLGTGTYTLGDVIYSDAANSLAKLGGNTTSTKKFLRQTGTGTVSAAPAWDTIVAADVPGSALTKTDDTNVTLTLGGSSTTALLNAASVTLGWTGTLAIARGGTGASTAATGLSNLGGEPALGNPATDGYILTSTAAGVRSWLAPGSASGGLPTGGTAGDKLVKNSSTNYDAVWSTIPVTKVIWLTATGAGTYTPTSGCKAFYVELCAGGGAGAGGINGTAGNTSVGAGGSGGGFAAKYVSGTLKGSYSYSIGAGGTAASGAAGGTGGDTTFDSPSICTATGGVGGGTMASGNTSGFSPDASIGAPGAGTVGDTLVQGDLGERGRRDAAAGFGGMGGRGVGPFGGGRSFGSNNVSNGGAGKNYGGAGAGGLATSTGATLGGAGAQGAIRITEYF